MAEPSIKMCSSSNNLIVSFVPLLTNFSQTSSGESGVSIGANQLMPNIIMPQSLHDLVHG